MSEYDLKTQKYFAKVDKRRQKYLEAAKQNPASYKRHVFHMAIIAILVPTVLVVALFGFLVFDVVSIFDDARDSIFGINTQVVLLFIIISLLSALRVNMGKPEGIEISPEDAPNLFSMINDVRASADGPAVDRVFISGDINACITQPQKPFKFWKFENHLTLGLPLLNLLTPEETKAVIAHEFGHFCAGDGKLGNWLYRAGIVIERLEEKYEEEGASLPEIPLAFFVSHFGERFLDRIFPLMREQEYAADAMAAQITSPDSLASALLRLQIGANYMAKTYWPSISKQMLISQSMNVSPVKDTAKSLINLYDSQEVPRWLNAGLLEENDYEDTHPRLSNRLSALNIAPFYPQAHHHPASHLLGHSLGALSEKLDADWRENTRDKWDYLHNQGKEMQAKYQELVQTAQSRPLNLEESIELVEISDSMLNKDMVYGNINYLINQHAESAEAWLYAGNHLLRDGQPQCIDYLQYAANLNSEILKTVHFMMAQHYREMGNQDALNNLAA